MAEVTRAEAASCRKSVQELVENGDDLPQRYIWIDAGDYGPIDLSAPTADIPVIDLAQLTDAPELLHLRSALTSWGCFQVPPLLSLLIIRITLYI